ncbi:MAG: hypothetical protein ACYSU0_04680 [Planctomycetota bacterium]
MRETNPSARSSSPARRGRIVSRYPCREHLITCWSLYAMTAVLCVGCTHGLQPRVPFVFLGNGAPHARGHLFVIFGLDVAHGVVVRREDLKLTDSEGFTFSIGRGRLRRHRSDGYFLMFKVNTKEALSHIRYNDPEYWLTLSIQLSATRTVVAPRINPTVEEAPSEI